MSAIASAVGNVIGLNQANNQQQQGYSNAAGIVNQYYPQAQNAINTGYNNAQTNFNNQYTGAGQALREAYPVATGTLQSYGDLANTSNTALKDLISSGYGTKQFSTADLNSQLAPNYDFLKSQLTGSTNAAVNTAGGLLSGNALQGLQSNISNFAQNAYQQAFNNYQTQRNNIFSNLTGTSNVAAAPTTALSGLQSGYGSAQSNLLANQGLNLANMNVGQGQSLASLYTGQGNLLAGNNINAGNAAAGNTVSAYNQAGQGFGNAIGNATNLGGAISNIGNLFKLG